MLQKLLFGVLAVATVSLTSLPSEAATFGTYGGTFNNGTAFDLTSNNSAPYSGMYIIPGGSLTLAGITQLSANYNMLGGSLVGARRGLASPTATTTRFGRIGAPRLVVEASQIQIPTGRLPALEISPIFRHPTCGFTATGLAVSIRPTPVRRGQSC